MKLYTNLRWMKLKYITERKTEQEIAEICGVDQATINRWLKKHKIHKSQK